MAAIAATTTRIRVGSAGVMLPHYAALKVAEQFRVLEAIAPGRIDLGVGRAPGSDRLTALALNPYANAADEFPQQVRDLLCWIGGTPLPEGHPFRRDSRAVRPGPTQARGVDPRQLRLRRAARGALRIAVRLRVLLQRRPGRRGSAASVPHATIGRAPIIPTPKATICVWALAADTRSGSAAAAAHARALARRASSRAFAPRCCRPTKRPRSRTRRPSWAIIEALRAQGASSVRRTRSRHACASSRSAWASTSSSSSRGPSTPRRAIARTSCWRRRSVWRAR